MQIYVPPLNVDYLARGHACHFRAGLDEIKGIRIDILARMRGCAPFEELWSRKKTVKINRSLTVDIIGLEDLVQSKKTQRDKDWFMFKRLLEIDILSTTRPSIDKIEWWLSECITAELLVQLSEKYPPAVKRCLENRPLLKYAAQKNLDKLASALLEEERTEREKDKIYWGPLRKELERLRRVQKKS